MENGWHGKPAARTSCFGHRHLADGVLDDVAERVDAPVALVDRGCVGVLLDGVHALAAQRAERGVEAADPGEEVDEGERRRVELMFES